MKNQLEESSGTTYEDDHKLYDLFDSYFTDTFGDDEIPIIWHNGRMVARQLRHRDFIEKANKTLELS